MAVEDNSTGKRYLYLILLALVGFAGLTILALKQPFLAFDLPVTRAIQSITLPGFAEMMHILTWIGSAPQVYVISIVFILGLLLSGWRWEAFMSAASLVLTAGLGMLVKFMIARPRPGAGLVRVTEILTDYSFPSGHVLFYTIFFGFLLYLTVTLAKPGIWQELSVILLGLMIALIGVSRIYAGHHWASDVLGAYLLGSICLWITVSIYQGGKRTIFTEADRIAGSDQQH